MYAFWIVASAAGFLTHYFFVFPWIAIVAYLLIRPEKFSRLSLIPCLLLTAILFLPWYTKLPQSLSTWRITRDWLKWQPRGFNRLAASGDLVLQFFSWPGKLRPDHRTSDITALILFGFVAVAMVWRLRAHVFSQRRLLLWLLFVATCTGPLAFDFVQHSYTTAFPRYALAALPAAYLLAGAGLACLGQRTRVIVLVLIVLAWAPNVLSIYSNQSRNWQPIREVSHSVCANSSSSDLILIHSIPSGVLGIARYVDGPAELASWVGQLRTRHVPGSIRELAAGRKRVLFVRMHEVREPAPEEDWLRANAVVSHETRLGSARIIDFRPLQAETF